MIYVKRKVVLVVKEYNLFYVQRKNVISLNHLDIQTMIYVRGKVVLVVKENNLFHVQGTKCYICDLMENGLTTRYAEIFI